MRKNKNNTPNKALLIADIILVVVIIATAAYLYVAREHNYWPFKSNEVETVQEETYEKSTAEETALPENTESQPSTPDNSEDTETTSEDDGYVEGKTPVQYEGQTDNSQTEYNNEQFRIPEGELE